MRNQEERSGVTMLLKAAWSILVVLAMWLMTRGLWATTYIERTPEAVAAERRGHDLMLLASVLLVGLAAFAYLTLAAPLWVTVAILAAVAVCVGMAMTDAFAIISLLAAYPITLGALVGGLVLDRRDYSRGPLAPASLPLALPRGPWPPPLEVCRRWGVP